MLKKILIGLVVLLIVIQFIRPERNLSKETNANHIAALYPVPENVKQILQRSCNDCHTNYTNYPGYANIQPLGFWLQHHINEGKEHLNFSEFGSYTKKKQAHKLEETVEMVEKGEMPLGSYTAIHKEAKLTKEDAAILINWAKGLQQQIEGQQ
jgi:homoserine trans-succinylase